MPKTITYSIPAEFDSVCLIGLSVRALSQTLGDGIDPAAIEVSVVEGINNAIKHGAFGRPDLKIDVEVFLDDTRLEILIYDDGTVDNTDAIMCSGSTFADPTSTPTADLPENGFGLAIIRSHMDTVDYERAAGRNVLRLTKCL